MQGKRQREITMKMKLKLVIECQREITMKLKLVTTTVIERQRYNAGKI